MTEHKAGPMNAGTTSVQVTANPRHQSPGSTTAVTPGMVRKAAGEWWGGRVHPDGKRVSGLGGGTVTSAMSSWLEMGHMARSKSYSFHSRVSTHTGAGEADGWAVAFHAECHELSSHM